MAEDKDDPKPGLLNLNNPEMKTSYANYSHVHLNATDLYLYFGIQNADGVEDVSLESRIIMTHDSFMRMMEFWATRYSVLVAIYGTTPRNLRDFDEEKVRQAFINFMGQQPNAEEQEDAQKETDA